MFNDCFAPGKVPFAFAAIRYFIWGFVSLITAGTWFTVAIIRGQNQSGNESSALRGDFCTPAYGTWMGMDNTRRRIVWVDDNEPNLVLGRIERGCRLGDLGAY